MKSKMEGTIIKTESGIRKADGNVLLEEVIIEGKKYYKLLNEPQFTELFDFSKFKKSGVFNIVELSKKVYVTYADNKSGKILDIYDYKDGNLFGLGSAAEDCSYELVELTLHYLGRQTYVTYVDNKSGKILNIYSYEDSEWLGSAAEDCSYELVELAQESVVRQLAPYIKYVDNKSGKILDIYSYGHNLWLGRITEDCSYELVEVAGNVFVTLVKNSSGKILNIFFEDYCWIGRITENDCLDVYYYKNHELIGRMTGDYSYELVEVAGKVFITLVENSSGKIKNVRFFDHRMWIGMMVRDWYDDSYKDCYYELRACGGAGNVLIEFYDKTSGRFPWNVYSNLHGWGNN